MHVFWGMKICCDISVVDVFCCLFCLLLFVFFVFFFFLGGGVGQGSASTIFGLCLIIQSIKHQVPFHVVV